MAERAVAGVRVRCIFDAIGSFELPETSLAWCKNRGIEVEFFHRFFNNKRKIPFWTRALERTHRKAIIIDGQIAFVGGVNIKEDHRDWRDIQIKLLGETVATIQETFNQTWNYLQGNYLERARIRLGERLKNFSKNLKIEIWRHEPRQKNQKFQKLFTDFVMSHGTASLLTSTRFF